MAERQKGGTFKIETGRSDAIEAVRQNERNRECENREREAAERGHNCLVVQVVYTMCSSVSK